jgi:DNA primase
VSPDSSKLAATDGSEQRDGFLPAQGCPLATDREAQTRQIKEASDIVDVVGGYVTLQPAGGKFKGLCPFHDDHAPSMIVDPKWQNFKCWACGKAGDVFSFIQEKERVDFREARELLARRAGISLEKIADSPQQLGRASMLDVMRWADELYQKCLSDSPLAAAARDYVRERGLSPESVHQFGLGFAPPMGDWLLQQASRAKINLETLETVGLIAKSNEGTGYYHRFRDRVMFPIRNTRGQTVGFGGRILPSSPFKDKAPKYYNSTDTPLFSKSEQLYGLDLARVAGAKVGYLAIVEGYTDVIMAHQHGVCQVVATMGTALNVRHVRQLRRFVPRVVLVFDADAGGDRGVESALELFAAEDMDLAIATLPAGLDPCDLLVEQGPDPFTKALQGAINPLEFKLNQVSASPDFAGIDGKKRGADAVLNILALMPELAGHAAQLRRELMINRIAQRLGVREEILWARVRELQAAQRPRNDFSRKDPENDSEDTPRVKTAAPHERDLIQALLAEPALVPAAMDDIRPEQIEHPGVRLIVETMYALHDKGVLPDVEQLRERIDNQPLIAHAFRARDIGLQVRDRSEWLDQIRMEFRKRQARPRIDELRNQLHAAGDDAAAIDLLRQLQDQADVRI